MSTSITHLKWLSKYKARKQVVFITACVLGLQFGLTNKARSEITYTRIDNFAASKLALFYFSWLLREHRTTQRLSTTAMY